MEEKTGFHFVFRPWRIVIGLLAGVGYLILLQQYGVMTVTTTNLIVFLLLGVAVGILLPTLATLIPKKNKSKPAAQTPPSGGMN